MSDLNPKTAAVVVTYNRKNFLKICLDSLLNQTRCLDSIILINNASTDGTEAMLMEKYLDNPTFDYVNLGENLGCSGGFYHGIKRAYEKGFDWIWCLDDDVAPLSGALETYLANTDKALFIQGGRISANGDNAITTQAINERTGRKITLDASQLFEAKDYADINVGCFEGAFLSRSLIPHIGFPDPRIFIEGDDLIYGLLASKYTNVILLKEPVIQRLIEKKYKNFFGKKIYSVSPLAIYYQVRNRFIIEKYCQMLFGDVDHTGDTMRVISKILIKILFFERKKMALSRSFIRGIKDGLKARTEFRPKIYKPEDDNLDHLTA